MFQYQAYLYVHSLETLSSTGVVHDTELWFKKYIQSN